MIDLSPGFSAIRSQGSGSHGLGSCSAMAATAIVEYLINRAQGYYGSNKIQLSPLFNYYYNRKTWHYDETRGNFRVQGGYLSNEKEYCDKFGHNDEKDTDSGAKIIDVRESLLTHGVCREEIWPYDWHKGTPRADFEPEAGLKYVPHVSGLYAKEPHANAISEARNVIARLSLQIEPINTNPNRWISKLKAQLPVLIAVNTTTTFMAAIGVRTLLEPGSFGGGKHAVVLVGYD